MNLSTEKNEEFFRIQDQMQSRINNTPHIGKYRFVGGADLTDRDGMIVGCFVVVDCQENNKVIYQKCTEMKVDFKYQAGLLCFREGPVVISLYNEFCQNMPDIKLDVILCDGSGEWHYRGLGLASYVGVKLQIPTIGVFKNFLSIGPDFPRKSVIQKARENCRNIGEIIVLDHQIESGRIVRCGIMKTTNCNDFSPIYISPGNLIDFDSSIEIVRNLCKFREPEPLRLADRLSRQFIREKSANQNSNIRMVNKKNIFG